MSDFDHDFIFRARDEEIKRLRGRVTELDAENFISIGYIAGEQLRRRLRRRLLISARRIAELEAALAAQAKGDR